jgi:sodium-dependent dicarboxylate transporter 2/3/5
MNHKYKLLFLGINLIIYMMIMYKLPLEEQLAKGLAIFVFIALLWVFEILHITVTSLLVPILAVVSGVLTVNEALSNFASPILFLFMGGFALAAALHKYQLDSLLASKLLRLAGGKMLPSAILVFTLTAFLSMWISNTATVAIMIPLVLGILRHIDFSEHKPTYLFFLLGTAYAGSIGGMGTLIGSPPNAIAATQIGYSFSQWLEFGIPMVALTLPIMIIVLFVILRPNTKLPLEIIDVSFRLDRKNVLVLGIFAFTVVCWMFSKKIGVFLGIQGSVDALIAINAIILLSVVHLVTWQEIDDSTDWGVLILFGGGITLSAIMQTTGASEFLADSMTGLADTISIYVFLVLVIAFVVFLTELTSNTASSALIIPIFVIVASGIGIDSNIMAVIIAFAASCAFMLPVATPPNALVYATGFIRQKEMLRVGFVMNLVLISTISLIMFAVIG